MKGKYTDNSFTNDNREAEHLWYSIWDRLQIQLLFLHVNGKQLRWPQHQHVSQMSVYDDADHQFQNILAGLRTCSDPPGQAAQCTVAVTNWDCSDICDFSFFFPNQPTLPPSEMHWQKISIHNTTVVFGTTACLLTGLCDLFILKIHKILNSSYPST